MTNADERAARILKSNKYLTLATTGSLGPWAAPINYVVGPAKNLIFYSARESRHAHAVGNSAKVAICIFDSKATSDEVDGFQAEAICIELAGEDLDHAHHRYFETNYSDDATRDWWYRPTKAFSRDGVSVFYSLALVEAYVIDYESVTADRIDRRIPVDVDKLWRLI